MKPSEYIKKMNVDFYQDLSLLDENYISKEKVNDVLDYHIKDVELFIQQAREGKTILHDDDGVAARQMLLKIKKELCE